jgi:hypothetical protein
MAGALQCKRGCSDHAKSSRGQGEMTHKSPERGPTYRAHGTEHVNAPTQAKRNGPIRVLGCHNHLVAPCARQQRLRIGHNGHKAEWGQSCKRRHHHLVCMCAVECRRLIWAKHVGQGCCRAWTPKCMRHCDQGACRRRARGERARLATAEISHKRDYSPAPACSDRGRIKRDRKRLWHRKCSSAMDGHSRRGRVTACTQCKHTPLWGSHVMVTRSRFTLKVEW